MSLTLRMLAGVVLGVGCLVVMARGQDTTKEPAPFPGADRASLSDGEPTPARSPNPELGVPPEAAGVSVLRSQYQTPAGTSDQGSTSSALKRPSAADRLQQVRETSGGFNSSITVSGPVAEDPTNPRSLRVAEQSRGSDKNFSSRYGRTTNTEGETSSGSVLKKAPSTSGSSSSSASSSTSDRQTARRVLRSPTKSSVPTANGSAPAPLEETEAAPVEAPTAQPLAMKPRGGAGDNLQPVLQSRGPAIRVETHGPKALKLGTESTYIIEVHNDGDTEAQDVFVRVGVPVSAKVNATGSAAETTAPGDASAEQRFVWTIARLASRTSEKLSLSITPTDGRPIDLFVDWTIRPVSALAQIEVQQPQLEMSVFGPKDIAYGEVARYTIRLSNSGNGDADDVTVDFGYGQEKLEPRKLGTLAAGSQQEISLELTARQTGAMPVIAAASAAGGLRAEASQEVLVRRAALEAEVGGDAAIFAGSPANYRIVIRNAGNAPAGQVTALITLPNGAQLVSGGDEAKPEQGGLSWNLGVLPTNGERRLDLQCVLNTAGDNAIRVQVVGAGDLESSGSFVTRVEALADLKLTVNDPQGPVAVGQDALYEIHVTNRGTKAATKINVLAQFSPGIEPVEAKGSPAELVPGQVLFQAIPRIDPGQEVILIVRARADSHGPKRFRAEVTCEDMDTQLVAQETTHFYTDTSPKSAAKTSKAATGTIKR